MLRRGARSRRAKRCGRMQTGRTRRLRLRGDGGRGRPRLVGRLAGERTHLSRPSSSLLPAACSGGVARLSRGAAAADNARGSRFLATVVSLGGAVTLAFLYDKRSRWAFSLSRTRRWCPSSGIHLKFAVDGWSVALLLLTGIIIFAGVLASWTVDKRRQGVLHPPAGAGHRGLRRLRLAGPLRLLPLLRDRSAADVPPHRHLGRRATKCRPPARSVRLEPLRRSGSAQASTRR